MELNVPEYLFGFMAAVDFLVIASIIGLIWLGAGRTRSERSKSIRTALILSVCLIIWFVIAYNLGQRNVFWAPNNPAFPSIVLGIFVPILVAPVLLLRSSRVAELVDAVPMSWLVGVQSYRVVGGVFVVLWWSGHMPWPSVITGVGDIATGLLAIVVAALLARKTSQSVNAAYAWCLFGIADLIVAVGLGALTSPGRVHLLALDNPNIMGSAFPVVMFPVFAVPASIILHVLCLWKIRRTRLEASPIFASSEVP